MKRLRFRFSVRTLTILVTLVCLYFGMWEATKVWGVPKRKPWPTTGTPVVYVISASSPMPFVVRSLEFRRVRFRSDNHNTVAMTRTYYLWLLSAKIPLSIKLV